MLSVIQGVLFLCLFFGTIFGAVGVMIMFGDWCIHKDMTRRYSNMGVKRANFKNFMWEFNKIDKRKGWVRNPEFPTGFWNRETDTEIHANILKFKGVGMQLDFISWIQFRWWLQKQKLGTANKMMGRWDDSEYKAEVEKEERKPLGMLDNLEVGDK